MKPIPERSCGILAHISSLPSQYGIGDIGPSSYTFIDFLIQAGQKYWQFLPIGPTNPVFDNSPYTSSSAFAGSYLLISPELLLQDGLLVEEDVHAAPQFSPYLTEFEKVIPFKLKLLGKAFSRFSGYDREDYTNFLKTTSWLDDYACFMTLKELYSAKAWYEWPKDIANREPDAIASIQNSHETRINYYRFEQYIFHKQWQLLRKYAKSSGVKLFGDIPIYVGLDSADVWAHQDIFKLDSRTLKPTHVAGVPPDYFSETGQRWGNPLYRWNTRNKKVSQKLLSWWIDRFTSVFTLVDVARIDHFRAFESYWSVPAKEKTAINGKWIKGPGKTFFQLIFKKLGPLNIIAEDLGVITPAVEKLRDDLCFPGMKVLQFAFDKNSKNNFLPCNYTSPNYVVYTGTHDNDTSVGWYLSDKITDEDRMEISQFANRRFGDEKDIHENLIYLALSSICNLAIIPLQDVLGFGNDCRMNTPGTKKGNWAWRCSPEFLKAHIADELREKTITFGRYRKE